MGKPRIVEVPCGLQIPNEFALETWKVDIICSCGGAYERLNSVLLSLPEKKQYKCAECGNVFESQMSYPRWELREKVFNKIDEPKN